MATYDVFNGDADGIIALLQLRLDRPIESELITGVKRDIELLARVNSSKNDSITVLDISMEKNLNALQRVLNTGSKVTYFDHHRSGEIPQHNNLNADIDLDPNICTALIVDKHLKGLFHYWAITAAYGDNLIEHADHLAVKAGLSKKESEQLKEFGTLINYNGYGANVSDLHFHPAELFNLLLKYQTPFAAIEDKNSPFYKLRKAYNLDIEAATNLEPKYQSDKFQLYELPNELWAKRVSGVFGNLLANRNPASAHGVLTINNDDTYTFSLRAPLENKIGAGDICSRFASGGGRAAAAGINELPKQKVEELIKMIENFY